MENVNEWQREHEREVAEIRRESQDRTKQNKIRLDIQFAMIDASAQLLMDELLAKKSDEYKLGFDAGRLFEKELTMAMLNA